MGGREGGREGRRDEGEGGRDGGMEGREGGTEGWRGGREGGKEGGEGAGERENHFQSGVQLKHQWPLVTLARKVEVEYLVSAFCFYIATAGGTVASCPAECDVSDPAGPHRGLSSEQASPCTLCRPPPQSTLQHVYNTNNRELTRFT